MARSCSALAQKKRPPPDDPSVGEGHVGLEHKDFYLSQWHLPVAMALITTWAEIDDAADLWPEVEDILLAAAPARAFQLAEERDRLCWLWAGYYRDRAPQNFYLWRDDDGAVLAYLCALTDSAGAVELAEAQPAFRVFADFFARFPAHFHVNCRADCRGRGIGGALVDAFLQDCRDNGVAGVHLVTTDGARNVSFYRRHGLRPVARRSWRGRMLQLMARRLAPTKAARL